MSEQDGSDHCSTRAPPPRYKELEVQKHKRRTTRTSIHTPRSRKRRYMSRRAAASDTKQSYRAQTIKTFLLSEHESYAKGAHYNGPVAEHIPKTATERAAEATVDTTTDSAEVHDAIDLTSDTEEEAGNDPDEVDLPSDVVKIQYLEVPADISIPHVGDLDGWCGCKDACVVDICKNSRENQFCGRNNCINGPKCGNVHYNSKASFKRTSDDIGIGVYTKRPIPAGTIVGEYAGVMNDHPYHKDTERTSDYALRLKVPCRRGRRKRTAYVEAKSRGSIARFMNHSCDSNCLFFELRYRRQVAVAVITVDDIEARGQLTVDYKDIWFDCSCGSVNCRNPVNQEPKESESISSEVNSVSSEY